MGYLLALVLLATGGLALLACAIARPDRNYWPMVRVIFAALAFVYIGSGVSRLLMAWRGVQPAAPATVLSLVFSAAILGALLYGVWFIRKRNRTARFIELDLAGAPSFTPIEDLERAALLTASWVNSGAAPAATVERLGRASAEWHRQARWPVPAPHKPGAID